MDIYYTKDGSIGLYDDEVQDIYHATSGAYSESVEKFIMPSGLIELVQNTNEVRILDVCYGIGYNTKTAIEFAMKANKNVKIKIDALEYNQELIILSAFLDDKKTPRPIRLFLVNAIFEKFKNNLKIVDDLLKNPKYKTYLSKDSIVFYNFIKFRGCKRSFGTKTSTFLHNIYYQYISLRYFWVLKSPIWRNIEICYHIDDARKSIKPLVDNYDLIFLDAFTPSKQPILWTFHFFERLRNLMKDSSMILTYSNSVAIRSAMLANNLFVGSIPSLKYKSVGTVASQNAKLIKHPLSEYDLGLVETTAGIYYVDENLSASNDDIINRRKAEVLQSERQTTSSYIKRQKRIKDEI